MELPAIGDNCAIRTCRAYQINANQQQQTHLHLFLEQAGERTDARDRWSGTSDALDVVLCVDHHFFIVEPNRRQGSNRTASLSSELVSEKERKSDEAAM